MWLQTAILFFMFCVKVQNTFAHSNNVSQYLCPFWPLGISFLLSFLWTLEDDGFPFIRKDAELLGPYFNTLFFFLCAPTSSSHSVAVPPSPVPPPKKKDSGKDSPLPALIWDLNKGDHLTHLQVVSSSLFFPCWTASAYLHLWTKLTL